MKNGERKGLLLTKMEFKAGGESGEHRRVDRDRIGSPEGDIGTEENIPTVLKHLPAYCRSDKTHREIG